MSFVTRSSIKRLATPVVLVALGVFILLVAVGGSTASATLSDGDVVLGAAPNNACTPEQRQLRELADRHRQHRKRR